MPVLDSRSGDQPSYVFYSCESSVGHNRSCKRSCLSPPVLLFFIFVARRLLSSLLQTHLEQSLEDTSAAFASFWQGLPRALQTLCCPSNTHTFPLFRCTDPTATSAKPRCRMLLPLSAGLPLTALSLRPGKTQMPAGMQMRVGETYVCS